MLHVFRILAAYVVNSGINCMNQLSDCYSNCGSLGSIWAKYIKFYLVLYFLFTFLCMYIIYIYTEMNWA